MKIKNKQIPLRTLFCIAIGWLHCALIFAPIYTLLRHYIVGELTKRVFSSSFRLSSAGLPAGI